MTPEAQNRAICEALGKQQYHKPTPEEIASGSYYQYAPDFTNDLNAMHEAEKVLGRDQIHKFLDELEHIVVEEQKFSPTVSWLNWLCIHSPASIRPEAFLKTLGLWKQE
jgi:hypothetical protein